LLRFQGVPRGSAANRIRHLVRRTNKRSTGSRTDADFKAPNEMYFRFSAKIFALLPVFNWNAHNMRDPNVANNSASTRG
jgi:hypothetical protein